MRLQVRLIVEPLPTLRTLFPTLSSVPLFVVSQTVFRPKRFSAHGTLILLRRFRVLHLRVSFLLHRPVKRLSTHFTRVRPLPGMSPLVKQQLFGRDQHS